jgi:hypothetical protein
MADEAETDTQTDVDKPAKKAKAADPVLVDVVLQPHGLLGQMAEADIDAAIEAGAVLRRATATDLALGAGAR